MPVSSLPSARPFNLPVRVYWEDTDAGGIVYYANYLKFFERARTEWLRALGVGQQGLLASRGVMFVVAAAELHYLQPARLDDELSVSVQIEQAGKASLVVAQEAWRSTTRLVQGRIRIGCVAADATGTLRPTRIPQDILLRLT